MTNIQAVTDTSEYHRPYYTVQISYAGTGAEFRINDIPFYLESFSGQVDTEIPVGDKIISGKNELSVIVFPYIEGDKPVKTWNPNAFVEATLFVREKDAPRDSRKLLTHIKYYPLRESESSISESLIIANQGPPSVDTKNHRWNFPRVHFPNQAIVSRHTDYIKAPFPRWEWQDGQIIQDTDDNYRSLLEAYRKEYSIQEIQDLNALKESTRKLAGTQMLVNYYENINTAYEMLNLEESWKSEDQELFPFIEGEKSEKYGMMLDIVGNGKLARITNDTGIQPVLYIVKKARMTVKYKYIFYKNKQGEWIYIM